MKRGAPWRMATPLPTHALNSHQNGGPLFLIFVANPITVRLSHPNTRIGTTNPYCLHACLVLAWHNDGMNRIRLSTTVDAQLLSNARTARSGITDAALIDEALAALLAHHRSAEIDASYARYEEHPPNEPDEWGDLASWRRAAGAS
jgi:hypothetical protein